MSRVRSQLAHILRQALFVGTTVCLVAGMGSIASADEFKILGANGSVLTNATVNLENRKSQSSRTMRTDNAGQLFLRYSGQPEVYQVTHTRAGRSAEIGTMVVNGKGGLKTVRLR